MDQEPLQLLGAGRVQTAVRHIIFFFFLDLSVTGRARLGDDKFPFGMFFKDLDDLGDDIPCAFQQYPVAGINS